MKTRTETMRLRMVIATMVVLGLLAAACGGDEPAEETTPTTVAAATTQAPATTATPEAPAAPVAPVTRGPGGEAATPSGEIVLSAGEAAEVQSGGYTAALLWHTAGAFTDAVSQGARDAFAELGIEVIAETNAQFDAAQQANDANESRR